MAFTTATLVFFKASATWILLQWLLEMVVDRTPTVKPVVTFMRSVNKFVATAFTTLCALLVLLPSFVFVVLEVFAYVRLRTRSISSKSFSDYVTRGVQIISELEALGERIRQAATKLNSEDEEIMYEPVIPISVAEPVLLPQRCGNVLLAVCRHNESMERLYAALSPPEVDDLIYCDCEDFEFRGEKVVSMIGMLRVCMDRQTDVVKAVDALCPILPPMPASTSEDGIDDSGFIDS